jgi:type II secretory pathway component PulC
MKERAMMVLRPGVNALLLAAVALGCAQLGWNALTPNLARGSADAPRPVENAAIRSPFNPSAEEGVGASPAAEAILSSVRLSGVRVASEPALSGAVLTLADGEQRAFVVGQEIGAGVRLADVRPDHVLLSHEGGQRRVSMQQRALSDSSAPTPMGADAARVESVNPAGGPGLTKQGATLASADDARWLAGMLSRVQSSDDGQRGWRVAAPLPAAAEALGLRDGDLVLSVNGHGPDQAGQAVQTLRSGKVNLLVMRGRGERVQLTLEFDAPA